MKNKNQFKRHTGAVIALSVVLSGFAPQIIAHAQTAPTSVISTQMKEAQISVSVAEQVNYPDYTSQAFDRVNALPNSSVKTDLLNRLNNVKSKESTTLLQNRINMIQSNGLYQDISYAQSLLSGITNPQDKTFMQNNLNNAIDKTTIDRALKRIDALNRFGQIENLGKAQSLVSQIKNVQIKDSISKQLAQSSDKYYANLVMNYLQTYNSLKLSDYLIASQQTLLQINDLSIRSSLEKQVDEAKSQYDAQYFMDKFNVANATQLLPDYYILTNLSTLDSSVKTDATNRTLMAEKETADALLHMVNPNNETDLDATRVILYDAIKDTNVRNSALTQLNSMEQRILESKANYLVQESLSSRASADLDYAKLVINQLQNTSLHSSLLAKVMSVQPLAKDPMEVASVDISRAEISGNPFDRDLAKFAFDRVPSNSANKTTLQSRMDNVMDNAYFKLIDAIVGNKTIYGGTGYNAVIYKTQLLDGLLKQIKNKGVYDYVSKKVNMQKDNVNFNLASTKLMYLSKTYHSTSPAMMELLMSAKSSIDLITDQGEKDYLMKKYTDVETSLYIQVVESLLKTTMSHAKTDWDMAVINRYMSLVTNPDVKAHINSDLAPIKDGFYMNKMEARLNVVNTTKDAEDIELARANVKLVSPQANQFFTGKINGADDNVRIQEILTRLHSGKIEDYDITRLNSLVAGISNASAKADMTQEVATYSYNHQMMKAFKFVSAVSLSKLPADLQRAREEVAKLSSKDRVSFDNQLNALAKMIPAR